ncbi:MAG: ABC transporter permease [Clostridiales bacterium]|nr:ABC transporter permease [Clostridiales bacterium]
MHTSRILPPIFVIIGVFVLWEALVRAMDMPSYVLPAPSAIAAALGRDFSALAKHGLVTLGETGFGLAFAIVGGVLLAVLMDALPSFRRAAYPLLIASQTIPIIILAPLFIIYFGFGLTPKVICVALMCFFPVAVGVSDGMARTDARLMNLLRSFGAKPLRLYVLCKLPAAMPSFFSSLRVAVTYSVTGAVVGEWLSSDSGLGFYMLRVKNAYRIDSVLACVLVIAVLSLLLNGLVRVLQRICIRY